MTTTLGSLLEARARSLAGRDRERAALLDLVTGDDALVTVVHGIAGVGKTALLHAFAADAHAEGIETVRLDGREIEPSADGFLAALAGVAGRRAGTVPDTAAALGALGERVVLAVDTYDLLGLLDHWLSATLVPALPVNVRVVLIGRDPPSGAWVHRYGDLLATLELRNLAAADAEAFLCRSGADPDLDRIARGHPLALQLAANACFDGAAAPPEDAAIDAIVEQLGRIYLDQLDEPTRRALAAASVTRRTTLSLLEAMLPDDVAWEAFDRLRRLPFVQLGADGLVVQDTMHAVTAALLRAADPAAYRRYRLAAWNCLRRELREAPRRELWRCTADMLFLVEKPIVRRFFFPAMVLDRSVEPAHEGDWDAIAAIAARDHSLDLALLQEWWMALPGGFAVVRDRDGRVTGFRSVAERDEVPAALTRRDPMVARWREHLRRDPVPRGNRVLFLRWAAIDADPHSPSSTQASLLLDIKHAYLAMRPELRRTYAPLPLWYGVDGTCAMALGYAPLPGEPDGLPDHERSLFNDYGPGSIDGWLADLAACELELDDPTTVDAVRREVRLDGARVDLTQLEFDVLRYLQEREGQAVRREALLRDVWGYEWTGGSNVVEVAISGLRKKLGAHAAALHTVRGVGYRLDALA
jgi:transcriptional regulator